MMATRRYYRRNEKKGTDSEAVLSYELQLKPLLHQISFVEPAELIAE